MQVTESLDVRYRLVGDDITFAELTFKPTLISGSSQLDGTTIQNLSGSFSGSFSGSYRGDGSGLFNLPALTATLITSGSATASIAPNTGLLVNTFSTFQFPVSASMFSGSGSRFYSLSLEFLAFSRLNDA